MKKLKKMMLAVLVLFYVGITVTVTLPDAPQAETYGANNTPTGPFGEDELDDH
ncbi:MAG: hypothetical protein K2N63_00930 [Lachnospiraceae bacterium]|nr:hypothetical protein [Lachnospiraceae bacterium]